MVKKTASRSLFIIILISCSLLLSAAEREGCSICGMYLDLYGRTKHVIEFNDGTYQSTCSLACAAKIYVREKNRIRKVMVADFLSGDLVDARSAIYLEGSDIPGVMSFTSRIGFRNKSDARQFKKKHGGSIISFNEALKHQLED